MAPCEGKKRGPGGRFTERRTEKLSHDRCSMKKLVLGITVFIAGIASVCCKQCPTDGCYGHVCAVGCERPPDLGSMIPTENCPSYWSGTRINYMCGDDYYHAVGPSWCRNGVWTHPKLICKEIDCGPPNQHVGFVTKPKGTKHRSTALISCDGVVVGLKLITCHKNGQWLPKVTPRCILNCRKPASKGIHDDFPASTKHGERPDIKGDICKPGYKPSCNTTDLQCDNGEFKPAFTCSLYKEPETSSTRVPTTTSTPLSSVSEDVALGDITNTIQFDVFTSPTDRDNFNARIEAYTTVTSRGYKFNCPTVLITAGNLLNLFLNIMLF